VRTDRVEDEAIVVYFKVNYYRSIRLKEPRDAMRTLRQDNLHPDRNLKRILG
jgi:hypothetical protein